MNPSDIMQWLPIGLLLTFSGVLTVTSVILVVKNYRQVLTGTGKAFIVVGQAIAVISKAIHANYRSFVDFARSKLLTRGAFFRYAILVCMMMSVVHGSHLFTTQNNISALDFALAATFDIGTWVLMEAMISTRKRGYLGASIGILVSIVIVSSISFLANLAFNAHYYDPSQFSGFDLSGYGLDTKAVLIGAQSSPPLIIILMTLVAETFIKADIKEEVTYAQRIWARHQRKIDREEAKLRLASERIKLQQQYKTLSPVKREIRVPAWSFLGFTVYQKQQQVSSELLQNIVGELRELLPEPTQNIAQSSAKVIVKDITNSAQTLPPTSQKALPEKTQSSEKDTDATLQKVPLNFGQTSGQTSGQTHTKVPEKVGQTSPKTSGPNTGELSSKVSKVLSSNTAQDLGKVTQKLSAELLKSFEEGSAQESTKIDITNRNAITKVEAAQYLQCSVEDINAAIKKGQIKMYGSSKDKVLVSTLKNYTPTKRRRTKVDA